MAGYGQRTEGKFVHNMALSDSYERKGSCHDIVQ